MGLLRLLFKLDADASGLKTKLHTAEKDLTGFSRRSMRDFRTGFTTFFSVSALRNMVRQAFQFAERYATDDKFKEKVNDLGTVIDDVSIHSIMGAQLRFQSLGYTIINEAIPAIDALGKAVWGMVSWIAQTGAALGALAANDNILKKQREENKEALGLFKWTGVGAIAMALRGIQKNKELTDGDPWKPIITAVGEAKSRMDGLGALADARVQKTIDELRDKNKSTITTPAEAAMAQTKRDSLAAIGGFTSRADMEIQSISKRQLRVLEKISNDTDNLNGGVPG